MAIESNIPVWKKGKLTLVTAGRNLAAKLLVQTYHVEASKMTLTFTDAGIPKEFLNRCILLTACDSHPSFKESDNKIKNEGHHKLFMHTADQNDQGLRR